jgi:hypothetical protein
MRKRGRALRSSAFGRPHGDEARRPRRLRPPSAGIRTSVLSAPADRCDGPRMGELRFWIARVYLDLAGIKPQGRDDETSRFCEFHDGRVHLRRTSAPTSTLVECTRAPLRCARRRPAAAGRQRARASGFAVVSPRGVRYDENGIRLRPRFGKARSVRGRGAREACRASLRREEVHLGRSDEIGARESACDVQGSERRAARPDE